VPAQPEETVVHTFGARGDGTGPTGGLIDVDGVLYGTTGGGGSGDGGTVFKITASGAESVVYSFKVQGSAPDDAIHPNAGVTNVDGVLYGTTTSNGSGVEEGTVFKVTRAGEETVLYYFGKKGRSDGATPFAGLTNVNGVLYGTTSLGGDENGDGTVFEITTSGAENVLHRFKGGNDGSQPYAGLTNVNGVLYGTTFAGGSANAGTVFKITTSGAETVLHSFGGANDGANPIAGLTNVNGVLYGTTSDGGAGGRHDGTVFKITTTGTESLLHTFGGGNDGRLPTADLTDVNGVLFGTTALGGVDYNTGTVFKITTSGEKTAVYRFLGEPDGSRPGGKFTNLNGVLYGTTVEGGAYNDGTVFSLSL